MSAKKPKEKLTPEMEEAIKEAQAERETFPAGSENTEASDQKEKALDVLYPPTTSEEPLNDLKNSQEAEAPLESLSISDDITPDTTPSPRTFINDLREFLEKLAAESAILNQGSPLLRGDFQAGSKALLQLHNRLLQMGIYK